MSDVASPCASVDESVVRAARDRVRAASQEPYLPSAPANHLDEVDVPQLRRYRNVAKALARTIGRRQPCTILGWRLVSLSHDTLRESALAAELALAKGLVTGWPPDRFHVAQAAT